MDVYVTAANFDIPAKTATITNAVKVVRAWLDYWRERPGTGNSVKSGVNIIFSDTNTHHRGEANYRTSGEVDAMRLPKDSYFAHQVMWDGWVNIDFALNGPVQWRGGIAQGPDNYILSKSLPVECGINRVAVRSTTQAGKIILTANSEGLKAATLELTAKPVAAQEYLVKATDANLPSRFDRGPTPTGASFQMLRQPLKIVSTKAGINNDTADQSFDDNEDSGWNNENDRAKGWIQYQLAEPATINELTLKMGGWREKSYPIRITVDGNEVWSGSTSQSLGYISIPVKPTKGKNVGIEFNRSIINRSIINRSIINRDSFGEIVELENQANAATGDGKAAKGTLSIREIEIYGPIAK